MQIREAIQLIEQSKNFLGPKPSIWADLGCGTGTFTLALAGLLPKNSTIYAIDQSPQTISSTESVRIHFQRGNFEQDALDLPLLDGILMANALHYIQNKKAFLQRLNKCFRSNKQFILVEYDTMHSNRWVPYPIDFENAKSLFIEMGFNQVIKLGERPSIYGRGNMYALSAI